MLETLNQNQQALSQGLSGIGDGLAPYTEISAWGQWFQIQTVYTCLANETACSYYEPNNPLPGSGPLGSPSGDSPLSAPSSTPSLGSSSEQSSIPDILGTVGGSDGSESTAGSGQ